MNKSLAHMRALVTGGAGFIGSHLVDKLLEAGASVAVLDNLSTGRRHNVADGAALFVADVRDRPAVGDAVAEFRPTHIFHLAAQASVKVSVDAPTTDADVNIMGSLHVLDAAVAAGVHRVVFASTGGALYGEVPEGQAAREEWPPSPKSPYGASKAAVEQYLRVYRENYGLASTVLRFANVYGPRQDPHGEAGVVAIFTTRLLQGMPVTLYAQKEAGDDGAMRDYVPVEDVVAANVLVAAQDVEGVFNVGTGRGTTTRQLLSVIERAVGAAAQVEPAPPRAGDLERSVLDPSALIAHGWRPRFSLAEGIERTVDWFRRHLPSPRA